MLGLQPLSSWCACCTMFCSVCWSSALTRRDRARHCLFLQTSRGIIPLTAGSMKVGVDRMHPDTNRRCCLELHRVDVCGHCDTGHHTGDRYSAGSKVSAVVDYVWCTF